MRTRRLYLIITIAVVINLLAVTSVSAAIPPQVSPLPYQMLSCHTFYTYDYVLHKVVVGTICATTIPHVCAMRTSTNPNWVLISC